MQTMREETLGQIAAKDLRKARVFKKYGFDFCCGGKKTVKEACLDKGLDVGQVEYELQQVDKNFSTRSLPYDDWSLGFLADYIVNTHHFYVKKSLPDLREYAAKVAKAHGNHHPELLTIHQLVEKIHAELSAHLEKEEKILFPFIKELAISFTTGSIPKRAYFGTVQHPITVMITEHEMAGKYLEQIRTLINNNPLPENACATYSLLYQMLDEFENDLHIHVHLENNILFPKALALENKLTNGKA
jgi:regulator of cell morphogenesis and NO signaling